MSDTAAWQVFRWIDPDDGGDAIDGRDPGSLVYVGLIVRPEDARSYWSPDEEIVGSRFGAGQYLLLNDETVLNWKTVGFAGSDDMILLDVVGKTRWMARVAPAPDPV